MRKEFLGGKRFALAFSLLLVKNSCAVQRLVCTLRQCLQKDSVRPSLLVIITAHEFCDEITRREEQVGVMNVFEKRVKKVGAIMLTNRASNR